MTNLELGLGGMAVLALAAVRLSAGEPDLRVMSFNVRYGSALDGTNAWTHRRDLAVAMVRTSDPDLLGTQEAEAWQAEHLNAQLPGYSRLGVGRDDGKAKGESVTLFFKTDRFEKLAGGHFWYGDRPDEPGSKGWDATLPRIVTWVKLRDRQNSRVFLWMNTHWDHAGKLARQESPKQMRRWFAEHGENLPLIVSADFNSTEDSPQYRTLLGEADAHPLLIDAFRQVHPERKTNEATYHAFSGNRNGQRIDWILCSPEFSPIAAEIDHTSQNGRYPSDHFPVTATLRWTAGN
jgi:endonuclease/exonuclease/phosphatase family metal-dependent hydrolase